MESLLSPLVLTKLRVPAARPRAISRARLMKRLAPEAGTGCILVCAPAGYGKTTLLAEWAQSLIKGGQAVAWYALDNGDNDPLPFGSYLIASLIQALGPIPELAQMAQILRSSPEVDLLRILPAVINATVSANQACVLILDDYHLITSRAIHSAVAYLLEHLPENLRIAIGSRSEPPLPLARLRARGQLLEIRAAGLRFKGDETAQFFQQVMGLDLPGEMVTTLETRTEGWVAGLQLAGLALQAPLSQSIRPDNARVDFIPSFTGSHRYLVEYLMEEVVNRQPEEVQLFLLLTSILERMCASLCEAIMRTGVMGDAESVDKADASEDSSTPHQRMAHTQSILDYLDRSNLFVVALDDQGTWYRYHHLFRDFLLTQLNKTQPERISALHRAACEWLANQGFLREAAAQAFQTRDWAYAAAFVEQYAFTLIVHSEISTLYEWCSAFPEEVIQTRPMLCLHQCWALVFRFRRQNRERIEARLRQAEQMIDAVENNQQVSELKETAVIIRTFLSMAPDPAVDPPAQLALSRSMISPYPEGDPGQFSGLLTMGYAHLALHDAQAAGQALEAARQAALRGQLYFGVVESTFHLARLYHAEGQLSKAEAICRQGQADIAALLSHPEQELPALGCLDIALGCVLLERDQLDEAEQHLLHGLDQIGWGSNPYYLMTALVALFRLREIQGQADEAFKYLARLEAIWPDIAFCTGGLRIAHTLRIRTGDPGADAASAVAETADAEAADWCKQFSPPIGEVSLPPGMGPFGAAEAYYLASLAWARVMIAAGSPQAALAYLERQLALENANGLVSRVIELSLLQAEACQASGSREQARVAIDRALALAQPEGYVRTFDQGQPLVRLLAEAGSRASFRGYVGRILPVITAERQAGAGITENASPARIPPISPPAHLQFTEPISEREREVLRLIARGATNQAIAEKLVISVGTVKSHINHILGKLNACNRTEAVARARELGLLE